MTSLIDRLKRLLAGEAQDVSDKDPTWGIYAGESLPDGSDVALDGSSLTRLMSLIEQTNEGEYACEETLDLLDEYAEMVTSDQDAASIMPLVKGHLEHCVDCTERYEALLRILEE